jgi:hypothetical protein
MRELILPSAYKAALLIVKSSASGGEAPRPLQGFAPGPHWGTSVPQTPRFAPPGKISWLRHCQNQTRDEHTLQCWKRDFWPGNITNASMRMNSLIMAYIDNQNPHTWKNITNATLL